MATVSTSYMRLRVRFHLPLYTNSIFLFVQGAVAISDIIRAEASSTAITTAEEETVGVAGETGQQPAVLGSRQGLEGVERHGDDLEQSSLRGCSATRLEAAGSGRTSPVARRGACKRGRDEKRSRKWFSRFSSFGVAGHADPPLPRRVSCLRGLGLAASQIWSRAHRGFCTRQNPADVSTALQARRVADVEE